MVLNSPADTIPPSVVVREMGQVLDSAAGSGGPATA